MGIQGHSVAYTWGRKSLELLPLVLQWEEGWNRETEPCLLVNLPPATQMGGRATTWCVEKETSKRAAPVITDWFSLSLFPINDNFHFYFLFHLVLYRHRHIHFLRQEPHNFLHISEALFLSSFLWPGEKTIIAVHTFFFVGRKEEGLLGWPLCLHTDLSPAHSCSFHMPQAFGEAGPQKHLDTFCIAYPHTCMTATSRLIILSLFGQASGQAVEQAMGIS